jgi:hypothetical protein
VAAASTGAGFSALVGGDVRLTASLAFAVAIVVAVRDFLGADGNATAQSSKGAVDSTAPRLGSSAAR